MNKLLFPAFYAGRTGLGLLALRVVFGLAFVFHGWGKITSAFTWMGEDAAIPGILQAAAAFAEFGGGLALILGLLTPLAALGLVGTMIGAMTMVHLPAGHGFVTMGEPSYELALVYGTTALMFFLTGPGAYSVDALLFKAKGCCPHTHAEERELTPTH